VTAELIEELPKQLESNLAELLMPGEDVLVKLKGAWKEALICTDRRVLIIKSGFMTGQTFGADSFQQPYGNIAGVQVKYGMVSGYIEISAGGMANTAKDFWSGNRNTDPAKAPNCVSLNDKRQRDRFQQAATFILEKVSGTHRPTAEGQGPADERESIISAIARLGELHVAGVLTEEEFSSKKAELLAKL